MMRRTVRRVAVALALLASLSGNKSLAGDDLAKRYPATMGWSQYGLSWTSESGRAGSASRAPESSSCLSSSSSLRKSSAV